MRKHYARNIEEELLILQFRKIRRRQVRIAFIGSFLLIYFFGGRDFMLSLVVSVFVAIGRWFFFSRNMI